MAVRAYISIPYARTVVRIGRRDKMPLLPPQPQLTNEGEAKLCQFSRHIDEVLAFYRFPILDSPTWLKLLVADSYRKFLTSLELLIQLVREGNSLQCIEWNLRLSHANLFLYADKPPRILGTYINSEHRVGGANYVYVYSAFKVMQHSDTYVENFDKLQTAGFHFVKSERPAMSQFISEMEHMNKFHPTDRFVPVQRKKQPQ